MSRLVVGGCGAACLVIGLYVLTAKESGSQPVPPPPAVATAVDTALTPATPKPSVLLPEVIDVTDIEHLLDPSPRPDSGVPFDPDPAVAPAVAAVVPAVAAVPDRIPPAAD